MQAIDGRAVQATAVEHELAVAGYARLAGTQTLALLGAPAAEDWARFAASWDDLGQDLFMADGGRYRRRRFATFEVVAGVATRKPHQPHFQSRDFNRLNGGVQRWFEPVTDAVADGPVLQAIFARCGALFTAASGRPARQPWHVELHQFRIEATPDAEGRPTPEGLHRDGVDWVFVMLVGRRNVAEGVTEIGAADGRRLGRFTLTEPGDGIFLDDRRVLHGVTPITPIDPAAPGHRDALVVTFRAP
ncbi:2OG-Fe dioxygenase family protein [Caulobacter sp. KR2-114]|uniref:2OG-Fe dioxygenase family protein n=1 Tax=Caulobacter sp. KR2-114 TaxID=3400912 RepID=UPI003C0D4F7E